MRFTRINMVEWIRESNAIENYHYTNAEIREVMDHVNYCEETGKPVLVDIPTIADHYKALKYVRDNRKRSFGFNDIYTLHFILMNRLLDTAGCLRSRTVRISDRICPKPDMLLPLLDSFLKMKGNTPVKSWSKKKQCLYRHYEFEWIHPFMDGNGRLGRLLMLWDCLENNTSPDLIMAKDKNDYYDAIDNYHHNERGKYYRKWFKPD